MQNRDRGLGHVIRASQRLWDKSRGIGNKTPRVLSLSLFLAREKKLAEARERGLKIQAPRSRRLIREKRPGKVCSASETPAD